MVKPTKGFLSIASIAALGALAACGTASTGHVIRKHGGRHRRLQRHDHGRDRSAADRR